MVQLMQLSTQAIAFIVFLISAVISIMLYINAIDRRVTRIESKFLNRDEFYRKMDELKEYIKEHIKFGRDN